MNEIHYMQVYSFSVSLYAYQHFSQISSGVYMDWELLYLTEQTVIFII